MCSYTILGSSCVPRGGAITSNAKFISPGAQVYSRHITPMLLYPGHTAFLPPPIKFNGNIGPESIKAWSSHPYKKYNDKDIHSIDTRNRPDGCMTCSGI